MPDIPIYSIKGGVHPEFHKKESTALPIATSSLPERLVVPMRQHVGVAGLLMVKEGDYVYKGQPLTEQPKGLGSNVHAPTSGTVSAIDRFPVPHVSGYTCPSIIIEADGKDDWGEQRLIPIEDYQTTDNELLLQRINEAGIVGLGGAVFPSAVKISSSAKSEYHCNTLIINGAECEPYITCDDMLMREKADEIVAGIQIIIKMLKPEKCLIGIEDNKPEAIESMKKAVTAIQKTARNGNSHNETNDTTAIKVIAVPTIYPSGDAKQLTKLLTGVEIPKQKRSYDMGSLCHNIATIHSVFTAVIKGEPLISRIVTVTGAGIQQPQNFQALIGTSFKHLIDQAGGYTDKVERLIMGGPMMGYSMKTDEVPVVKATNCILALPKEDLPYSPDMAMPCIRCGKCMDVCPVDLLPQQLYWHAKAKEFDKIKGYNLDDCIECGCCSYVCPSKIPLVSYYRFAKSEIREENKKKEQIEVARQRFEFREFRKAREKEERDAKRAQHKAALQKKKAAAKKAGKDKGADDKQDAIKAALARAKKKKAEQKTAPRNTENLTPAQQAQVDEIDARQNNNNSENKEAS